MKLLKLLLISLVSMGSAAPGIRRKHNSDPKNERALTDIEVTIDKELNENGTIPEGRKIVLDGVHPLKKPDLEGKDGFDGPATLSNPEIQAVSYCDYCYYDWWYGWYTYCCTYYTTWYYCDYYYC